MLKPVSTVSPMSRFHRSLLLLLMGIVLIDPTNRIFHMKEVLFVSVLFFYAVSYKLKAYHEQVSYIVWLFVFAILSIVMGGLFYNSNLTASSSYFKAIVFVIISFALSRYTIQELLKYLYYAGFSLSGYIVVLFISFSTGSSHLSPIIAAAVNADNTLMLASRVFLGIPMIMFFYKTMPICLFSLAYATRNGKVIPAIVILAAIIMGGSRTPILMGLVLVGYVLSKKSKRLMKYLVPVAFAIGVVMVLSSLLAKENQTEGDEIKYGISSQLVQDSSLVGHGVGVTYYTKDRGLTNNSEVTYHEMLYQYGYVLFPFVLYLFFSPALIIYRRGKDDNTKDFAVAYLLYLVNAGTNPLLISSTGMLVYAYALVILSKVKYEYSNGRRNSIITQ